MPFGAITPGEWYFKCGRTTDITAGLCNSVEAYCNWSEDEDQNMPPQHGSYYTEEFVILSKKNETGVTGHASSQGTFCSPGDSGSFIINKSGEFRGLLYGEVTGLCGPSNTDPITRRLYVCAGLVSCMTRVVIPSLEEKTTCLDQFGRRIHGPAVLELAR